MKNKNLITIKNDLNSYFSGILPTQNSRVFEDSIFQIIRDDGLTEIWFKEKQNENINWIEIKFCNSPSTSKPMIIDDYFIRSKQITEQVKKLLT